MEGGTLRSEGLLWLIVAVVGSGGSLRTLLDRW